MRCRLDRIIPWRVSSRRVNAAAMQKDAAGPVRAAAIKTGTDGLGAGAAKVKVPGGEMPVHHAKPLDAAKPPVILVAMEVFDLPRLEASA